jgi:4-carboxymuconolactone decarboxylase
MARLNTPVREDMTDAQRAVMDAIQSGPRGANAHGPFKGWLASPDFADLAQKLGAYLRFETSIPARLKELAILCVARTWTAQFEWYAHRKLAIAGGLAEDIIDALKDRRRPDFVNDDETVVYEFAMELLQTHEVGDAKFAAAQEILGEAGVSELVGVLGYYTLVSMTLNVFEIPLPDGEAPPLTK